MGLLKARASEHDGLESGRDSVDSAGDGFRVWLPACIREWDEGNRQLDAEMGAFDDIHHA